MGTIFLIFMFFVLCGYLYIQYDRFVKKNNKVQTGIVFDAEEMPSIVDEAWGSFDEGIGAL